MSTRWTPAQARAIDACGTDIVVSAGAGAGKTTVLVERLIRRLLDPQSPARLEQFLVITFTRAAAEEMRSRIEKRLQAFLAEASAPEELLAHAERELGAIARAPISTIHSFCLEVITAHADALGLPPMFELLSEEEDRLERHEFYHQWIETKLGNPDSGDTLRALCLELDSRGDVRTFAAFLESHLSFLQAIPDREAFVNRVLNPWREAADAATPWDSTMGRDVLAIARARADGIRIALQKVLRNAEHPAATPGRDRFFTATRRLVEALAVAGPALVEKMPPFQEFNDAAKGFRASKKLGDEDAHGDWSTVRETVFTFRDGLEGLRGFRAAEYFARGNTWLTMLLRDFGTELLAEFTKQRLEQRRLNFALLEELALRVLSTDDGTPSVYARATAAAFQEIMVDESQDVNPMQHALIERLRQPGSDLRPFCFTVGDVKQSIYGFRQAEPQLFLDLINRAADAPQGDEPLRVALVENFRSAPAVLQELNGVFATLFSPAIGDVAYDERHCFTPGRTADPSEPRLRAELAVEALLDASAVSESDDASSPDRHAAEAEYIAARIAEIGPPWGDIVVLLRSLGSTVPALVEALDARGIPVETDAAASLLHDPGVLEVLSLLRAIQNPLQDVPLLAVLRGPAGEWSEDDLLRLRFVDRRTLFFDALKKAASDGPLAAQSRAILARLERWQSVALRRPMAELVALLYDELHLLERAAVKRGGNRRRSNLLHLLNRARQFDQFSRKGLRRFLEFLDDLLDEGEDLGVSEAPEESATAVRLMSIHKSKGCEFPIVIVGFAGRAFNRRDLHRPLLLSRDGKSALPLLRHGAGCAVDPIAEALIPSLTRRQLSEELRLLYVALTRARERAIVIGSHRGSREALFPEHIFALGEPAITDVERTAARCFLDWMLQCALRETGLREIPEGDSMAEATNGSLRLRLAVPSQSHGVNTGPNTATEESFTPSPEELSRVHRIAEDLALSASQATWTSIRAKISVTEVKRAWEAFPDALTPHFAPPRPEEDRAAWMERLGEGKPAGAPRTHAGTATHRFLVFCDLEALVQGRRLSHECERLADEGLLAPEQATVVLLEELFTFFNSPFGDRFLRARGTIRREVPFTIAVDPTHLELSPGRVPRGPVVLQGVVDAYFRDAAGLVLVDFKTDWCGKHGERLPQLQENYLPQMLLYRLGLERALREPVSEAWLCFLRVNQPLDVPPQPMTSDLWKEMLRAGIVIPAEADPATEGARDV